MQIHELTSKQKVNEGIGDFFGLNNPKVKDALNDIGSDLVQTLAARFTRDPRYTKLPYEQRKAAIMRDEFVQDTAQKSLDTWNEYLAQLQLRNGSELNDQQYQTALLSWANRGLFNGRYNELDQPAKQVAQAHFADITKNRKDPTKIKNTFASLVADETSRVVQVATDVQAQMTAQSNAQAAGARQSPAPAAPAMSFGTQPGGEVQNPNDPATAQILAALKAQGKL